MKQPPLLYRGLLRLTAPAGSFEEIAADLQTIYAGVHEREGYRAARRRYRREVISFCLWRFLGPIKGRSGGNLDQSPQVAAVPTLSAPDIPYREGASMFENISQDIRFGFRSLRWRPGLTIISILILAVGIGANATIFTFMNGLFIRRPAAVERPSELLGFVRIRENGISPSLTYPDYLYYRDQSRIFSGLAATQYGPTTASLTVGDQVEEVSAWPVSANYFDVLGVPMAYGTTFPKDQLDVLGAMPYAILTHGFWRRRFGDDPSIVGREIVINDDRYQVVGITSPDFTGTSPIADAADIYLPLEMTGVLTEGAERSLQRIDGRVDYWLRVFGRLRTDATMSEAEAEMEVLFHQWSSEFSSWLEDTEITPYRLRLTPRFEMPPATSETLSRLLTVLTLVVVTVLLIACANIAILQLARTSERLGEIGIRFALGANRARIIRLLVTEGLLLAVSGGVMAIGVTIVGARLAAILMPVQVAFSSWPDVTVIGVIAGLSLTAALLFGLLPAIRVARNDLRNVPSRGILTGRRSSFSNLLVIVQMTLSMILITGAGLFTRSVIEVLRTDTGFEKEDRLVITVNPADIGYSSEQSNAFITSMMERIALLPEVEGVSTALMQPFGGMWSSGLNVPGTAWEEELYFTNFNAVGPDYFEVMGISLIVGRGIETGDDAAAPMVAVVNQVVADELWPGESPLGKMVSKGDQWATVVGVAPNVKLYEIGEAPEGQVYLPQLQSRAERVRFIISLADGTGSVAQPVRDMISQYDPRLAVAGITTMHEIVGSEAASFRTMAVLVGLFSVIALLLAVTGLYGLQAYIVNRKRHEIGVRLALGAQQGSIAGSVVRQGLVIALIGVLSGLVASYPLAPLVRGMLFGIPPHDPLTLLLVPLILLLAALSASLLPALRASRVSPMEAMRIE